MKLEIEISDESIEALAEAIAGKISVTAAPPDGGDNDDFGGGNDEPKELTLTDVQDALREAVGTHGKEKIKAVVMKVAKAGKIADIPREKYQAVLDALKKVK